MKRKLSNIIIFSLIGLMLILLPGCYDLKELEQNAFVLAFGMDKSQVKSNYIRFTVMIAIPKALGSTAGGGGGGGDEKESVIVTTIEAPTIPVAINLINTYIGRELNFHQSTFIFFGEEYAKEIGVAKTNFIQRYHEIRRSARLIVTRGPAEKFIREIKPKLSANPNKYLTQVLEGRKYTGLITERSMHEFYSDVENANVEAVLPLCGLNKRAKEKELTDEKAVPYEDYLPGEIERIGGVSNEFIGCAIFRRDHMVGTLNGTQTRILNLIRGDFNTAQFLFPDVGNPKELVGVKLKLAQSPNLTVKLKGKKAKIRINLNLEGELSATRNKTHYGKQDNINKLEQIMNKSIERRAKKLIGTLQERNLDIFDFGRKVAGKFWTYKDFVNYGWLTKKRFKEADIDLEVHTQIRRVGYEIGPSEVY